MDANELVFSKVSTKYCIRCTHPALLLFIEHKKSDLSDTSGINEFVATYDDDGFILDWMNEREFVTDDINAAILSRKVKTVPVEHTNWPALVEEDARTLGLMNALDLWRKGVATDEDILKAVERFEEESHG